MKVNKLFFGLAALLAAAACMLALAGCSPLVGKTEELEGIDGKEKSISSFSAMATGKPVISAGELHNMYIDQLNVLYA